EELLVYWEGHQKLRSLDVLSWDRRFLSWNYRGEPPQRRLHDIVRSRVGKNSLTLANYMRASMPVLSEAHAREYYGDELTNDALRSTGPIPSKSPAQCGPQARQITGGCRLAHSPRP